MICNLVVHFQLLIVSTSFSNFSRFFWSLITSHLLTFLIALESQRLSSEFIYSHYKARTNKNSICLLIFFWWFTALIHSDDRWWKWKMMMIASFGSSMRDIISLTSCFCCLYIEVLGEFSCGYWFTPYTWHNFNVFEVQKHKTLSSAFSWYAGKSLTRLMVKLSFISFSHMDETSVFIHAQHSHSHSPRGENITAIGCLGFARLKVFETPSVWIEFVAVHDSYLRVGGQKVFNFPVGIKVEVKLEIFHRHVSRSRKQTERLKMEWFDRQIFIKEILHFFLHWNETNSQKNFQLRKHDFAIFQSCKIIWCETKWNNLKFSDSFPLLVGVSFDFLFTKIWILNFFFSWVDVAGLCRHN